MPGSLVAQMVKNRPAMRETLARFLDWEDPLQNGTATHSSILAWRIPWTEEPGRLGPWDCKESDMTEQLSLSFFSLAEVMFSFYFFPTRFFYVVACFDSCFLVIVEEYSIV